MVSATKGFVVRNPLTVIGGIVTLIVLAIVAVFTFSIVGDGLTNGQRNLALITILGLVGNAIPSLLALLKSEATQHDIRNGVVKNKVKDAITEIAADTNADGVYIPTVREGDNNG